MEGPEIDPYKYAILTFDKGAKPIPWRKDNLFNNLCCTSISKERENLNLNCIPYTKISSKWITDLNIKYEPIKLLENHLRENYQDLGLNQ